MAKSLRSSTRKANNAQLKKSVFGPIEAARADRLSAKLLELAAQPKPKAPEKDAEMEEARTEDGAAAQATSTEVEGAADNQEAMDLDATTKPAPSKKGRGNKRIEKRRTKKKSSVVFPSFKDRTSAKKRR